MSNKRKLSLDNLDLSKMKILRKGERGAPCSQPALLDTAKSDLVIQSQDSEPGLNCGLCTKLVDVDEIEISSLQCCLCHVYFHGCCLDIDDEVLSLLYMSRIWMGGVRRVSTCIQRLQTLR